MTGSTSLFSFNMWCDTLPGRSATSFGADVDKAVFGHRTHVVRPVLAHRKALGGPKGWICGQHRPLGVGDKRPADRGARAKSDASRQKDTFFLILKRLRGPRVLRSASRLSPSSHPLYEPPYDPRPVCGLPVRYRGARRAFCGQIQTSQGQRQGPWPTGGRATSEHMRFKT